MKEKPKIKNWGYLFIAYFIYVVAYPVIGGIAMLAIKGISLGEDVGPNGPAGTGMILKWSGVSPLVIYFVFLGGLAIAFLIPLASLVGGILILKLRNSGRRLVVMIFSLDLIFRLGIIVAAFSNASVKTMLIGSRAAEIYHYIFILIDILIVYYFSTKKVKDQFINTN